MNENEELSVPAELAQQFEKAMNNLHELTAVHDSTWRLADSTWSVDQTAGLIVFESDEYHVEAPVQIAGTFDSVNETWLWGWDHPSVVPELAEHAKKVNAYGQEHGYELLTTRKLVCSEIAAWELAAFTCMLNEAQGVYRGPSGTTMVFFTFGEVSITKK